MTAQLRTGGIALSREDRDYIRRRIDTRVRRFESSVERVSFRLEDVNGPRGGNDKICRARVTVPGHPNVIVERRDHSVRAAVDGALKATEQAVRKITRRTVAKPRRARVRRAPARPPSTAQRSTAPRSR